MIASAVHAPSPGKDRSAPTNWRRILGEAKIRFSDLGLLALAGTLVLALTSMGIADRIPTGGHPAISIREDEYRTLYVFLSCNFAWLALVGAAVILAIAELVRRDRAWLAAAFATLIQAIVLFPLFMGDNDVLAEWRWFIVAGWVGLSFAFFAALLGPLRRWIASLRGRHPRGVLAASTALLGCWSAAAVALFHLLVRSEHIDLYPFVVVVGLRAAARNLSGTSGAILHRKGSSWIDETPAGAPRLYGIWGFTSCDIWAVGQNGITYHFAQP